MESVLALPGGQIRGVRIGDAPGMVVFKGIPYARVRPFEAPQPARPWQGVLDATAFGAPPAQSGMAGVESGPTNDVEDAWATVNVWAPAGATQLPVMVWIQGGAYLFGTASLPEYDGAQLASNGVVVVTFNYRVGVAGFGEVPGRPPNRGLLDQIAALEWVRENIHAFGGDPDCVTVFGQSAGAGSIAALLVMPRAKGLFRRAVVQSMPGTYFSPRLAADITATCATQLGVAVENLPMVDPQRLAAVAHALLASIGQHADRWGLAAHASVPIAPVVDGEILPSTPWEGLPGEIDLLVGHTRDEQRLLSALDGTLGHVDHSLALRTAALFGPDPQRYQAAFPDPEQLYEVVRSDWLFRMPSLWLAEAQLAAGGSAHVYELTWPAPGMGGALGACHGLDVPLVFGTLTQGQPALLIGEPTQEAVALSRRMRASWVEFARTGDPGWPQFASGATQLFDVEPVVTGYPETISREIWRRPPGVLDLC